MTNVLFDDAADRADTGVGTLEIEGVTVGAGWRCDGLLLLLGLGGPPKRD